MLKKWFWTAVVLCLAFGGIKYVSEKPHEAAKNGSHIVNEATDTGGGFIEGIAEFFGALDL